MSNTPSQEPSLWSQNSEQKKSKVGGARPGAGRPKGKKNSATVKREAKLKRALRAELADMSPERAQELADDPFAALTAILRTYLAAGDFAAAASTARELLPYCRPKLSSAEALQPLPADLEPDAPAQPDEPGPPGGIIDPGARKG